jgi:hypothetical protein
VDVDSEAIVLREKIQAKIEKFERDFSIMKNAMDELDVSRKWTPPEMNVDSGLIEVNIVSSSSFEF